MHYLIDVQLVTLHPAFLVKGCLCSLCTMLLEAEHVNLGSKVINCLLLSTIEAE